MTRSSATENHEGGDLTRLGPLESQVMELLWAGGEATVEQLRTALPDARSQQAVVVRPPQSLHPRACTVGQPPGRPAREGVRPRGVAGSR
ncbi:BlaI/MecI/CopY family transcriptional regulator [uncultured Tessaracoccus sp.]|uniref:BlaI/MecI/CopY family transcriptional regulator n=1 Tax=uncultured Tessaracoccus sp. TaxID=905023 RepID=UPI00262B9A35|nr:BlaI/MecI/CopY family transcriptional regulator [uncultured Tessaracoccus sp.]